MCLNTSSMIMVAQNQGMLDTVKIGYSNVIMLKSP